MINVFIAWLDFLQISCWLPYMIGKYFRFALSPTQQALSHLIILLHHYHHELNFIELCCVFNFVLCCFLSLFIGLLSFCLQLIKGCDFIGNIGSLHKIQCIDLFVTHQPCSRFSTKVCFNSHVSLTLALSTTSPQADYCFSQGFSCFVYWFCCGCFSYTKVCLEIFICNVILIKLINDPYFFKFDFHNHLE